MQRYEEAVSHQSTHEYDACTTHDSTHVLFVLQARITTQRAANTMMSISSLTTRPHTNKITHTHTCEQIANTHHTQHRGANTVFGSTTKTTPVHITNGMVNMRVDRCDRSTAVLNTAQPHTHGHTTHSQQQTQIDCWHEMGRMSMVWRWCIQRLDDARSKRAKPRLWRLPAVLDPSTQRVCCSRWCSSCLVC